MEVGGIHDVLYHGSGLGGFLRDLPDRIARFRRIATYESGYARIGYRCRVRRGGCMADRAAGAGTPGRLRLRLFRRFGTAGKRLLRLSVGQPRKEREIAFRSIAVAVCRTGPLYRAGLMRFSVSGRCPFRCGIGEYPACGRTAPKSPLSSGDVWGQISGYRFVGIANAPLFSLRILPAQGTGRFRSGSLPGGTGSPDKTG